MTLFKDTPGILHSNFDLKDYKRQLLKNSFSQSLKEKWVTEKEFPCIAWPGPYIHSLRGFAEVRLAKISSVFGGDQIMRDKGIFGVLHME